jgi:hypothetical protein
MSVQRARRPPNTETIDKKDVKLIVWNDHYIKTQRVNNFCQYLYFSASVFIFKGEDFLIHDSRIIQPDLPVFFAFASPDGLRRLKVYREWAIDGTFFAAPKHFVQLFTLNVFVGKSTAPCIYFLLPNKTTDTYRRALAALVTKCEGLDPLSIMSGDVFLISFILLPIYSLLFLRF